MTRDCKSLSVLAATALALGGLAAPASAQSLEEMKAQLRALTDKVEQLEKTQKQIDAKTEGMTPNKPAVTSGKKGVKLAISGQVNRGVLHADNGDDAEFFHVDNDNSSTRVRFIGSGTLNEDVSVGTQIEVQFESNSTASISFDQSSPAGPNNFTERKLELFADSKRLGRLWLGQGDTASNGTSEQDLSGTGVVGYSGIGDMAGGLEFQDSGVIGPQISQVFSNLDGMSRNDRVRYDTPGFGGAKASASILDGGAWDVAGRFAGKVAGQKVAAAVAYSNGTSRQGFDDQLNGSLSVLTPIGISLTAAAGVREVSGRGDDPMFYYGKLGYTFNPTNLGATSLAIDFTQADDVQADRDEFRSYGGFLVQNIDDVATEIYLGVRNHELDRPGADFDDLLAVLVGARIKF